MNHVEELWPVQSRLSPLSVRLSFPAWLRLAASIRPAAAMRSRLDCTSVELKGQLDVEAESERFWGRF